MPFSRVSTNSHAPWWYWKHLVYDINAMRALRHSVFLDRFSMTLPRQERKPLHKTIGGEIFQKCFLGIPHRLPGKINTPGALVNRVLLQKPARLSGAWPRCNGYTFQCTHFSRVKCFASVYCKTLKESFPSRASWEVLSWGMFDGSDLHHSSLKHTQIVVKEFFLLRRRSREVMERSEWWLGKSLLLSYFFF